MINSSLSICPQWVQYSANNKGRNQKESSTPGLTLSKAASFMEQKVFIQVIQDNLFL